MTPYKVGEFLVNKYDDLGFYCLVTETTEQTDGNFIGHYFYRYVYMKEGYNEVVEPNEVLDQCFYSFQDQAANYSLATNVPDEVVCLALDYCLKKLDKWKAIYNGIPTESNYPSPRFSRVS